MAVVTLAEVQQWLEKTKLEITVLSGPFEETARSMTFGEVAQQYPTTTWLDDVTTPVLIRKIVSMRMAGWIYKSTYSEDTGQSPYGDWLLEQAANLVAGIVSGMIKLTDVVIGATTSDPATFIPNNTTGMTQQYDALGHSVGLLDGEDIKFRMGSVF